jgi:hypothetical protein
MAICMLPVSACAMARLILVPMVSAWSLPRTRSQSASTFLNRSSASSSRPLAAQAKARLFRTERVSGVVGAERPFDGLEVPLV